MSMRPERFGKLDLKPKRWHGYSALLFILGSLFPPLAVAARFGIGTDFFINLVLVLCGYFPSHIHNFYIQNIRNNKNNRRTPKWAIRYGLIDDTAMKRRAKRSEWAVRYNERLPESALEGQALEDGQEPDRIPTNTSDQTPRGNQLWNSREEGFYGQPEAAESTATTTESSGGRWHYPLNLDDAEEPVTPVKSKGRLGKKKDKKDRWARTEDAYSAPTPTKKKKKSKSKLSTMDTYNDDRSDAASVAAADGPEDAVGGLYGPSRSSQPTGETRRQEEGLDHEF